jgi:LmbE family N-acetylglucosaminyl deacetylase
MKFNLQTAQIFIPDGSPVKEALARTTHLAISAHQDDIEIMAASPIVDCFQRSDRWFCGVVVTDGRGSPRADVYSDFNDDQMQDVRKREQIRASMVGEYAAQILLDYPSGIVKNPADVRPVEDLKEILLATRPDYVYTHNLADKHDTHVAITLRVIKAIRSLPFENRPQKLFGCEVWRALDWLNDEDKVYMDLSTHENLQAALLGVFDSQICGGKRYDLAALGRRKANATFAASHGIDTTLGQSYAMDLTPLITNDSMDPSAYVLEYIHRFLVETQNRIQQFSGM